MEENFNSNDNPFLNQIDNFEQDCILEDDLLKKF